MRADYFWANYGDFLLVLPTSDEGKTNRWCKVRNYHGHERYIPERMLQRIDLPWGIEETVKDTPEGVALPLRAFATDIRGAGGTRFLTDEVVMELTADGDETVVVVDDDDDDKEIMVIDYEWTVDSVPFSIITGRQRRQLNQVLTTHWTSPPWRFRVKQEGLKAWNEKFKALVKERKAEDESTEDKENPEEDNEAEDDEDPGESSTKNKGSKKTPKTSKSKRTRSASGNSSEAVDDDEDLEQNYAKDGKVYCGRKKADSNPCKTTWNVRWNQKDVGCKHHLNKKRIWSPNMD